MRFVVLITAPSQEEGLKIARMLVEKRLAVCVNVVPGLRSVYWWKGKIEESDEVLLVCKTKKYLFPEIVKEVEKIHSYTVPEIIGIPVEASAQKYAKWWDDEIASFDAVESVVRHKKGKK